MVSKFPAGEYSSKKTEWLGHSAIVLPTVTKAVKSLVQGKSVLDVGCGPGSFAKKFVEWGARSVFCIDNNEEMVEKCGKSHGETEVVECALANIVDFSTERKFDVAAALFVFQFLESEHKLRKAIENTYKSLVEDGILVAFVPNGVRSYNPCPEEGQKFGAAVSLPGDELRDGLPLTVNFYNGAEVSASSTIYFYFTETFERLLREAGFKKIEWMDPIIEEDALRAHGPEYFRSYMNPPKDIIFRAYK